MADVPPAARGALKLAVFAHIPAGYEPDTFPALDYSGIFERAAAEFERRCAADASWDASEAAGGKAAGERAARMTEDFLAILDDLKRRGGEMVENTALPHLGCPREPAANTRRLCRLRQETMAKHLFFDVFAQVKASENEKAVALFPAVLAELDQGDGSAEACFRGVLAGNLFDLGAADTAAAFARGESGFDSAKARLKPRPWLLDDVDVLSSRLAANAKLYDKAILFVDNAGADVMLGMVPLARALLRTGIEVVMAANEVYSINDVTYAELKELMPLAAAADASGDLARALADGRWRAVSSGSDLPVIDLRGVSAALNEEASSVPADRLFVVLEGMGRGIETNLNQPLLCDSMRIGMVKHPEVASNLGGTMYDCVCKFLPRITAM